MPIQKGRGSMKRIVSSLCLVLGVAICVATPEEMERLHRVAELKPSSKLLKAECMTCHTDVPLHNPFGRDVKSAIKSSGRAGVDAEIWTRLASIDSDQDGWSNGEEVRLDTLPGDPGDHPPESRSREETQTNARISVGLDQVIPNHSLHPVVIHFPIALFLFGVAFDLIGARKKDSGLRMTGWWGLLMGTISTAVAIPTGVAALLRSGYQWTGPALSHALFAATATALMISTTLWRRKGEIQSKTYFALLLVAALAVALAGHFGGQLVYGN